MKQTLPGLALLVAATVSCPLAHADSPHVLFVRGAERSGGFLEANAVANAGGDADFSRTEQLADINDSTTGQNPQTNISNHGWGTLAQTLRDAGFTVSQITETLGAGEPATGQTQGTGVPFESLDLTQYDAIVFGSNNAAYGQAAADAIETYLRNGGGAVFISDANFGGNWADASNSDQPFLNRLGLTANQDQGTYSLTRANNEFLVPDHPILENVDAFDGEGVTPVTVNNTLPVGVAIDILARAENQVRRNDGTGGNFQGTTDHSPDPNDAVLLAGTIDDGRFVWHFDRNTFFNDGGAGTDITRLDNQQLAVNLIEWVTIPEPATAGLFLGMAGVMLLGRSRRS